VVEAARKKIRYFHDPRKFERVEEDEEVVRDEDLYEAVDEDEEAVLEDEETVLESEEKVVAKPLPVGGEAAVEAYIWGIGSLPQPSTSSWLYAVQELKRLLAWKEKGAKAEKLDERLKRARRAVFELCVERLSGNCPIYNLSIKSCVMNLEAVCRPIAWGRQLAERRRAEKPRKWRRWYGEGGRECGSARYEKI
jgi:hypothetical protein